MDIKGITKITKENGFDVLEEEYKYLHDEYLDFLTKSSEAAIDFKFRILHIAGIVELFYKKDFINKSDYELFCDRINLKLMILDRFIKK